MLAIVPLTGIALQAHAQAEARTHAAAIAASGCEVDEADPIMDARVRPGLRNGGTVVATLSGGGGDDLGDLCVALVRVGGRRLAAVARQSGGLVAVADEVAGLSHGQVTIDTAAYRFKEGEAAIGVRVGGYFSSTATEVSWSHLHLLRLRGDKLFPILTVRIGQSMTDKSEGGDVQTKRWTVHLSHMTHRGAHDLVVRPSGKGRSTKYQWNGSRYVPNPGG